MLFSLQINNWSHTLNDEGQYWEGAKTLKFQSGLLENQEWFSDKTEFKLFKLT